MTEEGWNVVSAGPSREHLRKEHLLKGPVVTINRAFDIVARGFTVNYAAFADCPVGCWDQSNLVQYWRPWTILWVTPRPLMTKVRPKGMDKEVEIPGFPAFVEWDKRIPPQIGLRVLPYGVVSDESHPGMKRHAFTMLSVLVKLQMLEVKRIRILCADMSGSWIDGKTEAECNEIDGERQKLNRWLHEKKCFDAELKRARKDGVKIDCVTPEEELAVCPEW